MTGESKRLRDIEIWVSWVRVAAVPFAVLQVSLGRGYPRGYELRAWIVTALLAAGTALLFWAARRGLSLRSRRRLALIALVFDTAVVSSYVLVYSFELGSPIRQLLFLPIVEAALRYRIRGPLLLALATVPVVIVSERLRSERLTPHSFHADYITFQLGVEALMGLIVGWLVKRLERQTEVAETRAAEAEQLRDRLGRRVDLLDAANRCARALSSSLELEQAFNAFIRELRGLVGFDRTSIILAEGGEQRVMAAAGAGAADVLPPGSVLPFQGSVLEEILATNRPVYRRDMAEQRHREEEEFVRLGLRARLAAPLLLGTRAIGMLSIIRSQPSSFTDEEIELAGLLGRLVASAVQNIRAYEAERTTVEELRRLSALRADFVSLVSHELRSPMAAVIGSAQTLRERWRELSPEQRESFLALIADETNRLAALIGEVLDTSRIEAGTFSYVFTDVDVGELVRDLVAMADLGQDEVTVQAELREPLPRIRGDRERLRQVLTNLIDNAVKYSSAGDSVDVRAYSENGRMLVDVSDSGPGIAREHHKLIFEKFGRVNASGVKQGTGLGLFIARSIAEAHGGALEVRSALERGSTFTLALPVEF